MKDVVLRINRKYWCAGAGPLATYLFSGRTSRLDAVGFYLVQVEGFSLGEIDGRRSLLEVSPEHPHRYLLEGISLINDNPHILPAVREYRIRERFREVIADVQFL